MKKYISTFIIMLIVLISIEGKVSANVSPWASEAKFRLELTGILEGDLSDSSKIKNQVTRLEFAELITKFYIYVKNTSIERFGKISEFNDTDSKYVIAAYKLGIVKGISDTEFFPNSNITREQIAVIISRLIEVMDLKKTSPSEELFSDDSQISLWAKDGVYFCKADKLIQGIGEGKFNPKGYATREQVIKILDNALISYGKGLGFITETKTVFGKYKLPDEKDSLISYSKADENNIALRMVTPKYDKVFEFDIDKAAQEVYFVMAPVWGTEKAKTVSLLLKKEWSVSDMSFPSKKEYFISEAGILSKNSGKSDIKIYFNGTCSIELSK